MHRRLGNRPGCLLPHDLLLHRWPRKPYMHADSEEDGQPSRAGGPTGWSRQVGCLSCCTCCRDSLLGHSLPVFVAGTFVAGTFVRRRSAFTFPLCLLYISSPLLYLILLFCIASPFVSPHHASRPVSIPSHPIPSHPILSYPLTPLVCISRLAWVAASSSINPPSSPVRDWNHMAADLPLPLALPFLRLWSLICPSPLFLLFSVARRFATDLPIPASVHLVSVLAVFGFALSLHSIGQFRIAAVSLLHPRLSPSFVPAAVAPCLVGKTTALPD
ncbi:uncharacterized protein BJ171DRAFT_169875 [Polychytrium aggregatum]|uniref:uncharacterized protein n=1 Tax=Polychytrium aggregatum TaxID=110093 RepID=UPI0022FECC58|nr:uncharacterized protein BJ171DRAFT_169875 [Polychytrium aggregatum]KAI9208876.1 hypothetical protein BJ171DRAFT_169875 [Polychytrium aggregatum]